MLPLRLVFVVVTLAGLATLPTVVFAQTPTLCSTIRCVTTPEPATITLLVTGAGVAALWRARTKNKKK